MNQLPDSGPNPFVFNLAEATERNEDYRQTPWTGTHLQITVMCVKPGDDIGLEIHPDTDQFIRIESGTGHARLGASADNITIEAAVFEGWAVVVPAGTWHDITNTGEGDLKVYTIYAPVKHPHGTVHHTKADAQADPAEA